MERVGILEALRDFDTALLANTIGYIDATPPHEYYMGGSIRSVTPSLGPTVGVAVTCELDSSTPDGEASLDGYWRQLESIAQMRAPVVWVVKTVGARPDHECVMGDGMGKSLYAQGCIGVVTDGGLRDLNGLLSIPFAAYCRGTVIHHGALRFRRIDEPVEIGGITIRPGDVIHANQEGVIRVPHSCLEALPAKAAQMRAFEHDAHCVLRQTGIGLADKRQRVTDLLRSYGFRS
ncbi:MAG: RraA family protein [Acidimicrobiia bacterium]|nr:RraA family protein [Acidimicrobiia bacterium]